jgi:hypothetical protein
MNWLKKTWDWLDQKKTVIGTVALLAADVVPDPTISTILKGLGIIFGGVGIAHKVKKKEFNKKG